MILKEFGRTGMMVSEIGMGTYYDPLWIASGFFGWRRGETEKRNALRAGLESGMTLVDTAEIYRSEPIVAKALLGTKREDIFLATKVWSNHLRRDDLIKSLDRSLRNLGTSYVDLYQIHWPNPRVHVEETMGAMESLVTEGKVRHIGVSNFNLIQIEEANSALPKSQLSAVQLDYSLANRRVESQILPYCEENGIALLAYYPLGHGKLASDARLNTIATKHGKTTSQVALRWLAKRRNVFPIPRASTTPHVRENVGASGWELEGDDVKELESRFQ